MQSTNKSEQIFWNDLIGSIDCNYVEQRLVQLDSINETCTNNIVTLLMSANKNMAVSYVELAYELIQM